MKPQETLYVPHSGVLPQSPVSSYRRRGWPILATILAFCAVGWFALGILLLLVDSHSWDIIILAMIFSTGIYLFLARSAYRDWKRPIPRNLDTAHKV